MTDDEVVTKLRERSNPYYDGIMWRKDEFAAETLKVITRQQTALAECHKEIFKLRDALLAHAPGETSP